MSNIFWSDLAKQDYWNNIDFLLDKWTPKEATNFINKVETYLHIIAKNPKTFSETKYKNTHSIPVLPQITLFYRIVDENTIELVRFWNNKKDPKKLNI